MYWESWFTKKLNKRKEEGLIRELPGERSGMIDFASNDYLGLAKLVIKEDFSSGATGSRLLTGDSSTHHECEEFLSNYFQGESALLLNSGYQANLSLLSALPQRGDTILYDELSHASIKDGLRLSLAKHHSFRHNDLYDLEKKLKGASGNKYIIIEGIYSMDGDEPPLKGLLDLAENYQAGVIIDEAHSGGVTGIDGKGISFAFKDHPALLVRLYTFGKAYGAHGACFVGSNLVKDYLVNFARPFIYTTALPPHSLHQIMFNLNYLDQHPELREKLNKNIVLFKQQIKNTSHLLKESNSPIQVIIIPGNKNVKEAAARLQYNKFDIRPVLSPTVPEGAERLRICIHAFNNADEIKKLVAHLINF
ncbi:MAG: aminotransferase class I/II-fold pyridoxal phosphate-dependent enzyme [Candidatus Cyclobacteriaceae bacterium M2_1C_046]